MKNWVLMENGDYRYEGEGPSGAVFFLRAWGRTRRGSTAYAVERQENGQTTYLEVKRINQAYPRSQWTKVPARTNAENWIKELCK